MTAAQAAGYLQANDNLVFSTGTASQATVIFNPLTSNSLPSITLTYNGHSVTFGDDISVIRTQSLTLFPDSSKLYIGTTGDDAVSGTAGADGLFGGDGNDNLNGGLGNDLLQGKQGNDILTGRGGFDTIYG